MTKSTAPIASEVFLEYLSPKNQVGISNRTTDTANAACKVKSSVLPSHNELNTGYKIGTAKRKLLNIFII